MTMLRRIQCDRCKTVSEDAPLDMHLGEFAHSIGWTVIGGKRHACPNCRVRNVRANAIETLKGIKDRFDNVLTDEQRKALDVLLHGTGMKRKSKLQAQREQAETDLLRAEGALATHEMLNNHRLSARKRRQERRQNHR